MREKQQDYSRKSSWPNRRHPLRYHSKKHGFATEVLSASLIVGLFAWILTPQLTSAWNTASKSPEEVTAIEQSVYYRNCDAARDAGVTPIYRGQPGYREGMDGDHDGIACEPYR